jgi:hypothetical protein
MIEWRRVPWPLWVYAAVALLTAARVEIWVHGPILVKVLYIVVAFAWLYFIFRGIRRIWIATLAVFALGLAFELVSGSLQWWGAMITLIELMLLLLPVTQRYFSREQGPAAA